MAPTLTSVCREVGLVIETVYALTAQSILAIAEHLRVQTPPVPEPDDEYAHFFHSEADEYDCLLGVNYDPENDYR